MTRPVVVVTRAQEALWRGRGWSRYGPGYGGPYKTSRGCWMGAVLEGWDGVRCAIANPPPELLRGSHARCFTHKGNGNYAIHFNAKPGDIDSAILGVENAIEEAFRR